MPGGSVPGGVSGCGAHEVAGNVGDWCADWDAEDYYGKSPGVDPTGPASGDWRVLRGGSWHADERFARCSCRNWYDPDLRFSDWGFRVVVLPSSSL